MYNLIVPLDGRLYVTLHSEQNRRGGGFLTYFMYRLQIPQRDSGLPDSVSNENSASNRESTIYFMIDQQYT